MNSYRKIDENGLFLEDVILDEQPTIEQNDETLPDSNYITEPVPQGFYSPKWNGTEWVEGLNVEEITVITNQPIELTHEQEETNMIKKRLDETENGMMMLMNITMMGGF